YPSVVARFDNHQARDDAISELRRTMPDMVFTGSTAGDSFTLSGTLTETAILQVQNHALRQNIVPLHNRINELGVAEPVIQQQGGGSIIVELPRAQEVDKTKT